MPAQELLVNDVAAVAPLLRPGEPLQLLRSARLACALQSHAVADVNTCLSALVTFAGVSQSEAVAWGRHIADM